MTHTPQQSARNTAPLIEADILVVGAGLAGLSAAILLAKEGFSVVAVDRAPLGAEADLRTTALLEPAIDTLREAGVWDRVASCAAPLKAMRLVEAGARSADSVGDRAGKATGPKEAAFAAAELDREMFGANIANADLKRALAEVAAATPGLEVIAPARLSQVLLRQDRAVASLSDGRRVEAQLAVGADGRDSAVRAAAGVTVFRHDYAQNALVFVVAHDKPHDGVSTEILEEGGPFTLVPFTPEESGGRSRSSVVWMESRARAARLMALEDSAFEAAAQERSLDLLGRLTLASGRASWPIATMLASQFHGRRAALIAEAAHVSPPIGAQGLNMSLGDAVALRDLLREAKSAGQDIGADSVVTRLTRRRYSDVAARLAATAALNTAAIGALRPIRDLRRAGLSLIHGIAPLKRAAMRFGLG